MMPNTAPADAASSQQAVDGLPTWDLGDLYPAPDSPAVEADFARAGCQCVVRRQDEGARINE